MYNFYINRNTKEDGARITTWIGDTFSITVNETDFPKSIHVEFPQKARNYKIWYTYECIMQSGKSAYKHVV